MLLKTFIAQTFEYREMNFQCHVLYMHSPLESAHGQTQLQFVLEAFNTYAVLHENKYYACCNCVKSL